MIEVQVPKDVSVYESPLIGPLTSRQAICVAVAAAVEYVYYTIINSLNITLEMNSPYMYWYAACGTNFIFSSRKTIRDEGRNIYLLFLASIADCTKNRPYETVLTYDVMLDEIETIKEAEMLKKNGNKKTDKRRVTGFRKTERL